jgi:exonuclease III
VEVYGAAQPEFKEKFLTELDEHAEKSLPLLVGGDFNINRNPNEKNNDNYDDRWPFLFNAIINGLNLREIEMSGRKFTWASSKSVPTYEKLDSVLASMEWEQKFPLVTVDALNREISDHTPLLLSTGERVHRGGQPEFKFELSLFL